MAKVSSKIKPMNIDASTLNTIVLLKGYLIIDDEDAPGNISRNTSDIVEIKYGDVSLRNGAVDINRDKVPISISPRHSNFKGKMLIDSPAVPSLLVAAPRNWDLKGAAILIDSAKVVEKVVPLNITGHRTSSSLKDSSFLIDCSKGTSLLIQAAPLNMLMAPRKSAFQGESFSLESSKLAYQAIPETPIITPKECLLLSELSMGN